MSARARRPQQPSAPSAEERWSRHAWIPGAALGLLLGLDRWLTLDTQPALALVVCAALATYGAGTAVEGLARGAVEGLGRGTYTVTRAAEPGAYWTAVGVWVWGAVLFSAMTVGVVWG